MPIISLSRHHNAPRQPLVEVRRLVLLILTLVAFFAAPRSIWAQFGLDARTPTWRAEAPFTSITGVRELSTGEVVVVDAREQRVLLVSSDGLERRIISAAGAGPGEVRQPMGALSMNADSTAVPDAALRRVLVFDPTGKVVRHVRVPETVSAMMFGASALLEGSYFIYPDRWSPVGARAATVPVMRWLLGDANVDTLAWIQRAALPAPLREADAGNPAGRIVPYLPNDVLVSGSGAAFGILHAQPYQVSVHSATGALVRKGPPVSITRVRTSASERSMMPEGWVPAEKPPFTETGHVIDRAGRIWVRRSRLAGSTDTTYDVFSPRGDHLAETTLADGRLVVGAGADGLYVMRQDEEGFQYLERYRMPR